jgi:hypothetical protein
VPLAKAALPVPVPRVALAVSQVRQLVTADSQVQVVHLRPLLQGQAVADVVAVMKAVPAADHLRPLLPAPVDAAAAAAHQAVPLRLFHHADRF